MLLISSTEKSKLFYKEKMPKLFIESLPRNCTSNVLKKYFRKLTGRVRVKKSKNKGKKTRLYAVIEVFCETDFQKILESEHCILGHEVCVKPYLERSRKTADEEVVYQIKAKVKEIVGGFKEVKDSRNSETREDRPLNATRERNGQVQLEEMGVIGSKANCENSHKRPGHKPTSSKQPRNGQSGHQIPQSFSLFSLKKQRIKLRRNNLLGINLNKNNKGASNSRLNHLPRMQPIVKSCEKNTFDAKSIIGSIISLSDKINSTRHQKNNLKFNLKF